ncbi:hypothetical protein [Enterocloster bolteae]|uniref:hypothetical protein n=2 Tax=Enterocloster bolteae TaxID=208479 RepID=UPI002912B6DD|nr:hypothetical protein [Enterocloster bolteae]MDU3289938.1 hypothetical protein [Enterocloster bolteae]
MGLLSRMSRAATALTKYYIPYTWRNKPSIVSPVNEVNLNHIEDGINELDNRILILAQDKADAADVANVIIDFTMDDTTGVMTFTRFDGSTFTHDTAVEKIALNCYLEGDSFVLELADGTKQKVSLSKFIDTYTFSSTDTIRITANGKNISADIPDGKITLAKLEPTILSTIRQYTLDAQTAKGVAEQAASTAQGWAIGGTGFEGNNAKYYASKSQRYAVGGVEEGDAKDNAKAYCEAAKGYADQCAGVAEFDGTATSVSATDTHSLGSTNVQGQLDALADGLNNIDMSASSVTAVDTQGIAVNAGESSTVQALIDVIADKVMTKLLEKTAIVQVESTATNTVPSSAYFKQVKDDINSNLMKSYDLLISSTSTTGINQVVDVDNYREILLCATHSSNGTIYNAAMIPIGLFKSTSAGSMFRCSGGSFFAQCYTANGSITASVSVDGYCAKIYGIK